MIGFGKVDQGPNIAQFNACRSIAGVLPSVGGMILERVRVFRQPGIPAVAGLYAHGTVSDPSGATLLEVINIPSPEFAGEVLVNSLLRPALPNGAVFRFALMGDGDLFVYTTPNESERGDWELPRYQSSVVTPATGYPNVWPVDGGSLGSNYLSLSVDYTIGGGGGDPPPPPAGALLPGNGSKKLYSGIGFGAFTFR
jgi:hypothetical protein